MHSKSFVITVLAAHAQARFGQEHPAAINEISEVTSGGQPGQAATIAGGAISNLLAAANPCTKYQTGDNIIASLGNGADALKAAQDFVQAEQNFNPFNQDVPTICSDPTLPTTEALRGILPLIDPAVGGSDVANKLSGQSLTTPFASTGMSVAQILAANGFSNFTTADLAGNKGAAPGASSGASAGDSTAAAGTAGAGGTSSADNSTTPAGASGGCGAAPPATAATTFSTAIASATPAAAPAANSTSSGTDNTGTAAQQAAEADTSIGTSAKTTLSGVDFGLCVPTIFRAGGLSGRPATEFTFQAVDPNISKIQQEALNPNIITNRICDELTNQCQSNQAAKDVCAQAKSQISALGTRDQSTADAWNTALGF